MWGFIGAALAAAATLIGAYFAHKQAGRAEQRLKLETTVKGLTLLMRPDGTDYAPQAVVASGIATLVQLDQPVVAMRALSSCWRVGAVDPASAAWVISEVFETEDPEAQREAAAMLDAHATALCASEPGVFFWPPALEFWWIPTAQEPTRLHVFRAILRALQSQSPQWWDDGGRQGWAAALLYEAIRKDPDPYLRGHAARAVDILLPLLDASRLRYVQSAAASSGWIAIDDFRRAAERSRREAGDRRIVMLREPLQRLEQWAAEASR
jgi:hypothetical protein